jgi:hypothetical protein
MSKPTVFISYSHHDEVWKGEVVEHLNPEHVQQMDSVDHIEEMRQVGQAVVKKVAIEYFDAFTA